MLVCSTKANYIRLITLTLTIILFFSTNAFASEQEVRLYVDGERQVFTEGMGKPFIEGGRTFIPLRFIAESTGGEVDYEGKTQTIDVTKEDRTVKMTIGKVDYTVNGQPMTMDTKPFIKKGENRTYTPFRFVAEGLGLKVKFELVLGNNVVFVFDGNTSDAEIARIVDEVKEEIRDTSKPIEPKEDKIELPVYKEEKKDTYKSNKKDDRGEPPYPGAIYIPGLGWSEYYEGPNTGDVAPAFDDISGNTIFY
ncbi:MAG: copper amine oxidase N-terminal domain-containing protein [Clostridiales bacterium]|nr:copper amine oxidase N-terminal domain-containing protein [Clostridiales bacterium]